MNTQAYSFANFAELLRSSLKCSIHCSFLQDTINEHGFCFCEIRYTITWYVKTCLKFLLEISLIKQKLNSHTSLQTFQSIIPIKIPIYQENLPTMLPMSAYGEGKPLTFRKLF